MATKKKAPAVKAELDAAKTEKVVKKATSKAPVAEKKLPKYVKPFPVDYIVGTEEYGKLIDEHNELFNTQWNRNRVAIQVFFSIHAAVWKYYNGE